MSDLFLPRTTKKKWRRFWRRPMVIVVSVLLVVAGGTIAGVLSTNYQYHENLRPLSTQPQRIRVTVKSGQDAMAIGRLLEEKKVIKSASAFSRYVGQVNAKEKLQAGTYVFSPTNTVPFIVDMLIEGRVDTYNLTLLPGRRLDQIAASLRKSDFDSAQIEAALTKKYNHPLLRDKPANMDLEGYIFPDTYQLNSDTTVDQLFVRTFDTLYSKMQKEGTVAKLKAQGLNIHQGVTLASIVQQEVRTYAEQQKVAQVFLRRFKEGIPLGADPTFRYASHKAEVPDSVNIDSPYNTRKVKGLPPGPIGNFTFSALKAVANPADTNYLYFVAGDDGRTHFSHTEEEHQRLKEKYCIDLCKL